jgi:hypothetical protein
MAARSGRLVRPYSPVGVGRLVGGTRAEVTAAELEQLGLEPPSLAVALELLAAERVSAELAPAELVWTGPEPFGSRSRDTSVVVRELFGRCETSVLVAGFTVYQGRELFAPLVARMAERPGLRVRFFLNVARPLGRQDPDAVLLREFLERFRQGQWPGGTALPEIYYDPRSLSVDPGPRAVLHAKAVVVDDRWAFVSSANFTEAAHERNIEAGVLLDDGRFASTLRMQFDALVETGVLKLVR